MLCYVFVVCLLCIFTGTLHDTHVLLVHVHVTASLDWFFKSPHLANYLRELLSCQGNRFCWICSGKIHFTDNGNYFQFCGCDWNIRFSWMDRGWSILSNKSGKWDKPICSNADVSVHEDCNDEFEFNEKLVLISKSKAEFICFTSLVLIHFFILSYCICILCDFIGHSLLTISELSLCVMGVCYDVIDRLNLFLSLQVAFISQISCFR